MVPAYESLTVQKIWLYVNSFPETKAYYPDPKDREYLPKEWICNVAASVIGADFRAWIKEQISERDDGLKKKEGMEVLMDPEIYKTFQASKQVSSKYP